MTKLRNRARPRKLYRNHDMVLIHFLFLVSVSVVMDRGNSSLQASPLIVSVEVIVGLCQPRAA